MTSLRSAFDQHADIPAMNPPNQPQHDVSGHGNSQKGTGDGPFATITGREPFNTDANGVALPLNPAAAAQPASASQQAIHEKRMQKARVEIDNRFREICREEQKGISYIFFAGGVILGALVIYSFTRQAKITTMPQNSLN